MSSDNLPAVRFGVGEIQQMAQSVCRSRFFGLDESQAMTLMLLAQAKGLHPIQAVERYHVIKGRPTMKAEAMLAEFQANGGRVEWHRHDNECCDATFEAPGVKTPTRLSWTIADAKRAGLTASEMYTKYPRQMLRARVVSEGIRMTMPGIILGVYTPEEAADFEPIRRGAEVIEPPTPPDNKSGYGRGQYASPEQVNRFLGWVKSFVEEANTRWLDRCTGPDGPEAYAAEVLTGHQLVKHLLKWALRTGRLADVGFTFDPETGEQTPNVSSSKAAKYVAIVYDREPEALLEESGGYTEEVLAEAWAKVDHEDDLETTEAGVRG